MKNETNGKVIWKFPKTPWVSDFVEFPIYVSKSPCYSDFYGFNVKPLQFYSGTI